MNKTVVIEKNSEAIYSVFADVELEEKTATAMFHIEQKRWYVESLAMWLKWNPYFEPEKTDESIEVPPEIIAEMKRKQKEFDILFKAEGS
jgi:hypothetical protein